MSLKKKEENSIASPDVFFASGSSELFGRCGYVWEALADLDAYMKAAAGKLPAHEALRDGVPLLRHLVLAGGRVFAADDCRIDFGPVGRGELAVYMDGERLAGASVLMAGSVFQGRDITIGEGVLVESGAFVRGPAMIGNRTEVRQGAYLRGGCLIGSGCVVGHTTEVKNSIFLDGAKAGHFAYVGDSILGVDVNLGAGTKLANFRFVPGEVRIRSGTGSLDTGLRKFGAILGDRVQTGCNTVTSPGTLIGPDSLVMPNTTVASGLYPAGTILR